MYSKTNAVILALVAAHIQGPAAVQAIPPPIFGFPDSANHTELTVQYVFNGNTTTVQEAMLFGANITQSQPQLSVNGALYQSIANYTGDYLVIMVDPDASTPENPTRRFFLHWLAPNVTQSTTNSSTNGLRALLPPSASGGTDFVPYRAPTPPDNSSAHRYILYAFEQPSAFSLPEAFRSLEGGNNRPLFNLTGFMGAAGLDRPAAAEYFYVSRQPQVPGTFIAQAGGQYPGGNGGAIFENSTSTVGTGTGTTVSGAERLRAAAASLGGTVLQTGFWGLVAAVLW